MYFHYQVKKFQNDIYFICNCVNSVNRDDMQTNTALFSSVSRLLLLYENLSCYGLVKDDYIKIWLNFELQHFQKISNLLFGPFAADVEKLALVCFCFVLFFAESTRVIWYLLGSTKTVINTTLAYRKDFMLTWTITKDNNWSCFYHCEWLVIFWRMAILCHAQLHFTVELQTYIHISLYDLPI